MTTTSPLTFASTTWPPASIKIIKHGCATSSPRGFDASTLLPPALCRASLQQGALTETPTIALPLVPVAAAQMMVVAPLVTVVANTRTAVAAFAMVVAVSFAGTPPMASAMTTGAQRLLGPARGAVVVSSPGRIAIAVPSSRMYNVQLARRLAM